MDNQGREQFFEALANKGIEYPRIEIINAAVELPPQGLRFLQVYVTPLHTPRQVIDALDEAGLIAGDEISEDKPNFMVLKSETNPIIHGSDMIIEDVALRDKGIEELEAVEIYDDLWIGSLGFSNEEYNMLVRQGILSVGDILQRTPEQIMECDAFMDEDFMARINTELKKIDRQI